MMRRGVVVVVLALLATLVAGTGPLDALPAGRPRGATPSSLIVFSSAPNSFGNARWDLWSIRPDGTGLRQLTNDAAADEYPDLSPDRKTVVWQSDRGGQPGIYQLKLATGGVTALAVTPGTNHAPVYSPDGRYIAFVSDRDGTMRLYVMDSFNGLHVRPVGTTRAFEMSHPAWTSDSGTIVYAGFASDATDPSLFMVNVATGAERQLTTNKTSEPAISPDGKSVAFFSDDDGGVLYGDPTGDLKLVPSQGLDDYQPAWSPDGRQLVIVQDHPGHSELVIFDPNTGKVRQLTTARDGKADEAPTWR